MWQRILEVGQIGFVAILVANPVSILLGQLLTPEKVGMGVAKYGQHSGRQTAGVAKSFHHDPTSRDWQPEVQMRVPASVEPGKNGH